MSELDALIAERMEPIYAWRDRAERHKWQEHFANPTGLNPDHFPCCPPSPGCTPYDHPATRAAKRRAEREAAKRPPDGDGTLRTPSNGQNLRGILHHAGIRH